MSDLRTQLSEDLSIVSWAHLRPHHERDALVLVDDALDLVDVAVALAKDDTQSVAAWMHTKLVRRSAPDDDARWTRQGATFQFLIVRPWVLARELTEA